MVGEQEVPFLPVIFTSVVSEPVDGIDLTLG